MHFASSPIPLARQRFRFPIVGVGLLLLGLSPGVTTSPLAAQDYIYNPGPRGFDPGMNRYGITEQRPSGDRPGGDRYNPSKTTIQIDIITGRRADPLAAQRWSRALSRLGYSVRTHSAPRGTRPDIEETQRGPLRLVTLRGRLDSRGRLIFPGGEFSLADMAGLRQWLEELKMYGAQGSPKGQPAWGLSKAQFSQLHSALATIVEEDTANVPLKVAISRLGIPATYEVTFSRGAQRYLEAGRPNKSAASVAGLSAGTGLAYLLSEQGLVFHPERTPSGDIELRIEPLPDDAQNERDPQTNTPDFWPVGWELTPPPEGSERAEKAKELLPLRVRLAPKLFDLRQFGLHQVTLADAFAQARRETGVPILVAHRQLARAGIDLKTTRINLRRRHQSWYTALKRITAKARLRVYLRRDEAGHPLVWISTIGGRH